MSTLINALYNRSDVYACRLIMDGADVAARDAVGNTPLHLACRNNWRAIVRLLVERGADINAANNTGWTPLHTACNADARDAVLLLLARGAYVNVKTNAGETPLHRACWLDVPVIAYFLLDYGAKLTIKNGNGRTVLDMVCNGRWAITRSIAFPKRARQYQRAALVHALMVAVAGGHLLPELIESIVVV